VRLREHLGNDSLYVEEADGRVIGRFDLQAGKRVIMLPTRAALFESAVADWLGEQHDLPCDVYVVNRRRLRRWLEQQPEELHELSVEAIFGLARRSSTSRVP
jgi:hypothetical protein